MSSARYYKYYWNLLSRCKQHIRTQKSCSGNSYSKPSISVPCAIGFSFFTWLGLDEKKLTAEDELVKTIKHCILFIHRTEYEKAEQLLHVALRQAQQIQHQLGITYVYDVMANLALEREQLDKAKKLFVSISQRLMGDGASEDDPRIIHISAKLARISHLKKEYQVAQLGYDWCLNKLKGVIENDPTDDNTKLLALTEDWYGRLFLDCNQNEHGLNLMQSALNRLQGVPGVEPEEIVLQLNDIGTVCDKLGRVDDSIKYFTDAINIGKQLKDFEHLGTLYVNLGRAYIKSNLLNEARKSCGFALKLGVLAKNKDVKEEAELCIKELKSLA